MIFFNFHIFLYNPKVEYGSGKIIRMHLEPQLTEIN